MIILRHDQQDLKNAVLTDWNQGVQNVLAVLSTGGGKSIIASDIVLDGFRVNKQQAVIAHRNELVGQMSMHIADRGIQHRIVGSTKAVTRITRAHRKKYGRSFVNPSARTAVVGVDTLVARTDELKDWARQTDQWIIDEAHHVLKANKWGKAVELFPNARGLGLTATPWRTDGRGLGRDFDGVFDSMCVGPEMRYLIEIGAIADYEIVCPTSDIHLDDSDVGESGDWSNVKLREAAKRSHITGDAVNAYCQHAWGKQAICFATDVETAGEIAAKFNAVGIRAASLSAKTDETVREKYVEEFKDGTLKVLVNVDLFDEGFDVPACEVVIMARPTMSLGKYRQMVGRALRTMPGKRFGLIIDLVQNVIRHKLPDRVIPWTLARRDKRAKQEADPDEIPLTVCKHCTKPFERFMTACPHCGLAPPLPEPGSRTIAKVDGDLVLLDKATLDRMRAATLIEGPADLVARAGFGQGSFIAKGQSNRRIEKIQAQTDLKDAIAQWAGIQRHRGFSDSEIHKRFYLTAGVDVLTALSASQTRQDFEALTAKVKGWYL